LEDAPPRVRWKQVIGPAALARRRSLAIRHISGHRLVALLEILSPGNKDRAEHVHSFVAKAVAAIDNGVNLLMVDLFVPGRHDEQVMHGAILNRLNDVGAQYSVPADEPLTLASYAAGSELEIFLEHCAIGSALPDMPLFLRPEAYVDVPLESTYQSAFAGVPEFWRDVLQAPADSADR
jgi:hypothetical protein